MKSPRMAWLLRTVAAVGLVWFAAACWPRAAERTPADSRTAISTAANGKEPSLAAAKRSAQRSDDRPDASDARVTLELALENYQTMLAVIANNIANADTPGYKRSRVVVEDLAYHDEALPGIQDSAGNYSCDGVSVGAGSRIAATEIDFRQGRLQVTGRELDLAIEGVGFFQVKDQSGTIYYSRAGHFSLNPNGQISVASAHAGRLLEPSMTIPAGTTRIVISTEGVVSYETQTSNTLSQAGTIQLAGFINPQGLRRVGENLYEETEGSGTPTTGNSGNNSLGKLRQGWIETSNVDRTCELSEWNRVRRACRDLRDVLD
jgi:flagellar basal-body rod protein FlgG